MPRASDLAQGDPRRLLPIVAAAFAELGYRSATTAQLARRCKVRENVLYRCWPTKLDMFVASIEYVVDSSLGRWQRLPVKPRGQAARLLDFEAVQHGELGRYKIVFEALSEVGEPPIKAALRRMYERFHGFIAGQLDAAGGTGLPAELAAWAMIALGTMSNVSRAVGLMSDTQRRQFVRQAGRLIMSRQES